VGGWRERVWADGWAERGDKGGVQGYEAYEAKQKRKNYAVFDFKRKIFFIYL
jgi:hypothetical protein